MINKKFSQEVNDMLTASRAVARRQGSDKVTPSHLLLAIMSNRNTLAYNILQDLASSITEIQNALEQVSVQSEFVPFTDEDVILDAAAGRIMKLSVLESHVAGSASIGSEHVLLALLKDNQSEACRQLAHQHVTYTEVLRHVAPERVKTQALGSNGGDDSGMAMANPGAAESKSPIADADNPNATPALDTFGTDLTLAAREGLLDPVVGRDREILRVTQILSRRKKNNPILIGEPGVGKSAIVEGLALRIVTHRAPRILWDKRVVMLDMGCVVAGTKYRGQFEERMRAIIVELQKHPEIVVFIDEIHTIIGAGSAEGTMDAANMLKPALSRGEFQCIGATTINEFRKSIEKDGALDRRFQKVLVSPTTAEETLDILRNLRSRYEEHHNVNYTDEALQACVSFAERYITDRSFPDKAIDVMDEVGARKHISDNPVSPELEALEQELAQLKEQKNMAVKTQKYELAADLRDTQKTLELNLEQKRKEWEAQLQDSRQTVDVPEVADVISMMTGIPVQRIGQQEHLRLRNMRETLQRSVVGQDEAISTLVRAIQRSRMGLKDPQKPIGVFLFVGPTGVGKTYLTKKLAEELFGTADALIRLDMSEYMEKHTVSRMVGAPPGYVGYDEGGQLTEQVRRKPYSIVLLDEIEKAHKDVYNMLLQVMDEGRLTDGNGVTIDFRNTVIIMTSNSGSRQLKEFGTGVGFTAGDGQQDRQRAHSVIQKSLQKQFAPEFLNRLDEIVYFDALTEADILRIVDIELAPLVSRVADMGYTLSVSDEAKQLLAHEGLDVQYGARPLKRSIQSQLEDPLCQVLLESEVAQGATLSAVVSENKIKIEVI